MTVGAIEVTEIWGEEKRESDTNEGRINNYVLEINVKSPPKKDRDRECSER